MFDFHFNRSQVFGEVWTAPILTVSVDEIKGTVEKEIAEKEYQLKLKKTEKATSKAKAKAAPAKDSEVIEIDDDTWEIPSGDDVVEPKGKGKEKKGQETSQASAERKAAAEREKHWKNEVSTAAKSISSLNSACQSLKLMVPRCENAPEGVINGRLLEGLKEAQSTMNTWKLRACSAYL